MDDGAARSRRVAVVLGTRPEAVKLAPVIDRLGDRALVVHTGQHYDTHMWGDVAGDLGLPEPERQVAVGGLTRGEQIGEATTGLTRLLQTADLEAVVVQGDTNSTLAGALAGNATGTFVVHVEAGLRSGDLSMPEEANRLLIDRVADLCCAPTAANAANLAREGVPEDRIVVTGNTLAEAMRSRVAAARSDDDLLARLGVERGRYLLSTVHRAGTVDDPLRLEAVLTGLADLAAEVPVVMPVHPRTRARAVGMGLGHLLEPLVAIAPTTPSDFLALEAGAGLIASDSGGVQEEAVLLRVPLLVLRDSTERPELLGTWCDLLGDRDPGPALAEAWAEHAAWAERLRRATSPYDDDEASRRIVAAMDERLAAPRRAPDREPVRP